MKSITIIIALLSTLLIGCATRAQQAETHPPQEIQLAEGLYITEDGVVLEKEYPVAVTLCGMPMAVVTHTDRGTLWISGEDMMEVWGETFKSDPEFRTVEISRAWPGAFSIDCTFHNGEHTGVEAGGDFQLEI